MANITPAISNAWPEEDGSLVKSFEKEKTNSLENDSANALFSISLNGLCPGTPNSYVLGKRFVKLCGESK